MPSIFDDPNNAYPGDDGRVDVPTPVGAPRTTTTAPLASSGTPPPGGWPAPNPTNSPGFTPRAGAPAYMPNMGIAYDQWYQDVWGPNSSAANYRPPPTWAQMSAAQTPAGQPGSTAGGPPTLNRNDPASVQAFISYYASQPGANPSLARDPGYWAGKISSGELGDDPNYIIGKFMTPEGAPAGQGGNGMGPFTGLSAGEFLNDPGYKFRLQQGAELINNNRATSGLLRSGGTLKALTDYGQGMASQEYGNAFNRAQQVQGTNFNQNFSLAGLGLNANIAGINGANGLASSASSYNAGAQNNINNQSDLLTGIGNARAKGTIESQNQYNNLYGLGGLLTNPYYYR